VQHPTQIAGIGNGLHGWRVGSDQAHVCGKLPATQVRLVHTLAFAGAASEHFGVFDEWVSTFARKRQTGVHTVGHITQKVTSALLALVFYVQGQCSAAFFHGLLHISGGRHGTYLISPQVDPANRLEHLNSSYAPPYFWFPQNRFKNGTRRRGSHYVVRNTLYLHLRSGKAGKGACYFKTEISHFYLPKTSTSLKITIPLPTGSATKTKLSRITTNIHVRTNRYAGWLCINLNSLSNREKSKKSIVASPSKNMAE
jgi:hypothetical protein